MNYEELKNKINQNIRPFVLGMLLIVVALLVTNYFVNNNSQAAIESFKPLWESKGMTDFKVVSSEKYQSDVYLVKVSYLLGNDTQESSVLVSGNGEIFFTDWIYTKNLNFQIEEQFNPPKAEVPIVYTFFQPFKDKNKLVEIINLQEELGFKLEPGYYTYLVENASEEIKNSCLYETEGFYMNLAYCSANGKKEVYEAGFQSALKSIYGEKVWKNYVKKWALLDDYTSPNRTELLQNEAINLTKMENVIKLHNIPQYLDIESQISTQYNITDSAIMVNGVEYKGNDLHKAICSYL